ILVSYAAKGLLPYHGLGSGITRALRSWPHIDFVDDHENCLFTAVIRRVPMPLQKMSVKMSEEMSEKILTILQSDPQRTASQLATALGVTRRTIERAIAALRKKGRLLRIGPTKGGRWEVLS
ncbi:MAG: HTH domain-containing protein, partial [Desulfovibrio sp.]|nr:HTH domain-containing protein [Desulfovibrio sp.]